jgi:hypothetical protein
VPFFFLVAFGFWRPPKCKPLFLADRVAAHTACGACLCALFCLCSLPQPRALSTGHPRSWSWALALGTRAIKNIFLLVVCFPVFLAEAAWR